MPGRHLVTVPSSRSVRYKISAPAHGAVIQPPGFSEEWVVSSSNNPDWICATVAPAEFVQVLGNSPGFGPAAASGADWPLCSPGDSQGLDNSIDDNDCGNQD